MSLTGVAAGSVRWIFYSTLLLQTGCVVDRYSPLTNGYLSWTCKLVIAIFYFLKMKNSVLIKKDKTQKESEEIT